MTSTSINPELAHTLIALAKRRHAERPDAALRAENISEVMIGEGRLFVRIILFKGRDDELKCTLTFMNGLDMPIQIVQIYSQGKIEFDGSFPEDGLQRLENWPICPCKDVPYGYVDEDGMVRIIYMLTLGEEDCNGEFCWRLEGLCYVQEGYNFPEPFAWWDKTDTYAVWLARFWALADEGRVLRITHLLNQCVEHVWFKQNGGPHLVIEGAKTPDGEPSLVNCVRYNGQHPREHFPGELFRAMWGEDDEPEFDCRGKFE